MPSWRRSGGPGSRPAATRRGPTSCWPPWSSNAPAGTGERLSRDTPGIAPEVQTINAAGRGRGTPPGDPPSPSNRGVTMFEEADLIHRYTRAEALADGVLIDVSATAREAGIRW